MPDNLSDNVNEIDHDAEVAAEMGPAVPGRRTPRWVLSWLLPALAILVLYLSRQILGPFIIAVVIAYIFSMVVDTLQDRLHWPRLLIVTLLYLLVLGGIGIGLYFGAEALFQQTVEFINRGPNIIESGLTAIMGTHTYTFGGQTFTPHTLGLRISQGLTEFFGGHSDTTIEVVRQIAGRLLDSLLVIIVSFYLLSSGRQVSAYFLKFVPAGTRARTGYVAGRINTVLSAYLRGQLFLILLMSVMSFVVLQFIFHVPYALPIAILTGFLEILPLLGPALAATLAAVVALSAHGAGAAVGVVIAYLILRELEDNLVMPFVVGRAVDLHPVATIFAVLAGGAMAGALGMLLAVPAAAAIKVILDFLYPTEPEAALAQARPGLRQAKREAVATGEEAAPATPTADG